MATARPSTIDVPGLPTRPGLIVRRYRGPADHPGMAAANNALRASDRGQRAGHESRRSTTSTRTSRTPTRTATVWSWSGRHDPWLRRGPTWWPIPGSATRSRRWPSSSAPAIPDHATYAALLRRGRGRLAADARGLARSGRATSCAPGRGTRTAIADAAYREPGLSDRRTASTRWSARTSTTSPRRRCPTASRSAAVTPGALASDLGGRHRGVQRRTGIRTTPARPASSASSASPTRCRRCGRSRGTGTRSPATSW